jgi:cell division protein FtsN
MEFKPVRMEFKQSEWNQSSSQDEGIISGYRNENYANNVKPGSSGYYVTAGVYGESRNANRMASKLKSRGIQANVFRDSRNNMFYVYLLKFPSYYEADAARTSGLRGQYSGKLWIKVVK